MADRGFPDVPLNPLRDEDLGTSLGLDVHAKALAEFIRCCRTPMTVGIQGDWGSGKTSLMRLVEHKVGAEYPSVWFNTWQYSQFAQEDRIGLSMLLNLTRKIQALQAGDAWPTPRAKSALKRFGKALVRAASLAAGGLAQGALSAAGAMVSGDKLVEGFESSEERLDDAMLFERMRDDFATLIEQYLETAGCDRVTFYVDDLDRLEPARAIHVLEVLKNFVDVEGAVFVLAIDYDVIMRGLSSGKGYSGAELAAEGKSFFDKIIQVPYRMPTSSYRSDVYFFEQFKGMWNKPAKATLDFVQANAKKLIEGSIGNNPRSIKRLLNLHSLLCSLTSCYKVKEKEVASGGADGRAGKLSGPQVNQLLVLTAIQMAHFRIYALLARHPDRLDFLLIALAHVELVQRLAVDIEERDEEADEKLITAARARHDLSVSAQDGQTRLLAAIDLVADEIRLQKAMGTWHARTPRQLRTLATMLFSAIDANGNGAIEPGERDALAQVLQLAESTSVGDESASASAATSADDRINFRHLAKPQGGKAPILSPSEDLHFRLPGAMSYNYTVRPDCAWDGAWMKVIDKGKSVNLRKLTIDLMQAANARQDTPLFSSAHRQHWTSHWVVKRPEGEASVTELLDVYREALEPR